MESPKGGGVKVIPLNQEGYVGNPAGPKIDTAYDLAQLVEVRFSPDNIYAVQVGMPFNFGLNLRLQDKYMVDAGILEKLFMDLGESTHTCIDLGFLNPSGAILSQNSISLCFAKAPAVFTSEGFNYVAQNEILHRVGNYKIIARARQNPEPNNFGLKSAGVYFHDLEVIAKDSAGSTNPVRTLEIGGVELVGGSVHDGPTSLAIASGQSLAALRAQQPGRHPSMTVKGADLRTFQQRQLARKL